MKTAMLSVAVCFLLLGGAACGDANDEKIGGECTDNAACENEELTCLTAFKGGYCGASGCTASSQCPEGSACVGLNGTNYCFLICVDKAECNENRTVLNESNCSSNVDVIDSTMKVCVPPSG